MYGINTPIDSNSQEFFYCLFFKSRNLLKKSLFELKSLFFYFYFFDILKLFLNKLSYNRHLMNGGYQLISGIPCVIMNTNPIPISNPSIALFLTFFKIGPH